MESRNLSVDIFGHKSLFVFPRSNTEKTYIFIFISGRPDGSFAASARADTLPLRQDLAPADARVDKS